MSKTMAHHDEKKIELLEKCFECYAEQGFGNIGIKAMAKYCGCSHANLYGYFKDLDDLIIQATEHCMSKVEDEFMAKAPTKPEEIEKFIDEIPYWTAENHKKKYRLMYQIYTNPKYIENGKKFFEGVNKRYIEYAKILEPKLGIDYKTIVSFIFILVRASVHYALFEDVFYLKTQIQTIKQSLKMFIEYNKRKENL